ncbi:MAG: hypothetical protein AAGA48_00030 [Myxococcota bacterium]
MSKVLSPCLIALALASSTASAADVAYVGVSSQVATILSAEGHRVTRVTLGPGALVDPQGRPTHDVLVVGRAGTSQTSADAVAEFIAAGGHVVTEWMGSAYVFDALAPDIRFPIAQSGVFQGTVHAGYSLATNHPVDFTNPGHPLVRGLVNPLREQGGSEFFFWVDNLDPQLEVIATIRGNGRRGFPVQDLPVLMAGCARDASVVVATWDWQDNLRGANADFLVNAVDYVVTDSCAIDTSPPVIEPPADETVSSCTETRPVTLTPPPATDDEGEVTVTGTVVGINGSPVDLAIDGPVTLPIGEAVVLWTATDAAGNPSTVQQTVRVAPAIVGVDRLRVSDRAATDAVVASYGQAEIGADTTTGSVLALGDIVARSRALSMGDVVSAGEVRSQRGARATGDVLSFTDPNLPTLDLERSTMPPEEPLISLFVNSGTTEELRPGAYGQVVVNSGGILVLKEGEYTFVNLSVQTGGHVEVGGATIVTEDFTWRGTQTAPLDIEVRGSGWSAIEADFLGRIFAPETSVRISGAASQFTGEVLAGRLWIEPDVTLVCEDGR